MLPSVTHFASTPTSGQFAKEGAWEHAWSFPSTCLPDEASVCAYLGKSSEVAFEAFFGDAFFGARLAGQPSAVESFANKCIQALHAASRGESFMAAFREHTRLDRLGKDVAFAEVGCVNAWRSVGAFRIQDPRGALSDLEPLWAALEHSPVGRDALHRKAIEFAFDHPLPHWFGIPISASDGSNKISRTLLRDALRLIAP